MSGERQFMRVESTRWPGFTSGTSGMNVRPLSVFALLTWVLLLSSQGAQVAEQRDDFSSQSLSTLPRAGWLTEDRQAALEFLHHPRAR